MIIQCPSCNTKFAIDSAAVDGLEEPRFHCSRCDHVFGFEEATPSLRPVPSSSSASSTAVSSPPSSPVAVYGTDVPPTSSNEFLSSPAQESAQKQLPLTTRALQIPAPLGLRAPISAPHEMADRTEEQQQLDQRLKTANNDFWSSDEDEASSSDADNLKHAPAVSRSMSPLNSSPIESSQRYSSPIDNDLARDSYGDYEPENVDAGGFASAAAEDSSAIRAPAYSTSSPIDPVPSSALAFLRNSAESDQGASESEALSEHRHFDLFADRPSKVSTEDTLELPEGFAPLPPPSPSRAARFRSSVANAVRSFPALLAPAISRRQSSLNSGSASAPQAEWRGFSVLMGTIGGFLGLLGMLAVLAWSAPNTCAELSRALFPAAPQVAPPGLFIRNARFKEIPLESGEKVSVISGLVENDSAQSFNDVIVEGIVFDGSGKPLLTTRISVTSPLSKGRIRSLSPDLIQQSQRVRAPSDFRLRAGDQQEFAVVLNDGTQSEALGSARFYSARVYSVRY